MSERTVLVTGSTDGIGLQTGLDLARQGVRVVLHGRDGGRLSSAQARIAAAVPGARLEAVRGDLAELTAVRALAAEVGERFPRLDAIVHNAGVFMKERRLTSDSRELTLAVNHDAPVLLTHLLLPTLVAAGSSRVILVSSVAHVRGTLREDDLDLARGFEGYAAYAQSKLANVLFAAELAGRLPSGISAYSLHPGVVSTKLLAAGFGMRGPDSLEAGAETSVLLATAADPGAPSGSYFAAKRPANRSPLANDAALLARFYAASCARVGVVLLPAR